MITQAIGRAVLEMRFGSVRLTEYALSEKLEDMREKESNVIGKGVLRDAAELVRSGKLRT
ncbi:hypothetical protein [Pantoea vagans]|uniref:hypothetical protein n=1 Tax=Pantoea vagans TaxID=470934 RepID=UPI003208D01B